MQTVLTLTIFKKKDADAIFNKIIGDKNIGYPKNFVIPKTTANVGSLL